MKFVDRMCLTIGRVFIVCISLLTACICAFIGMMEVEKFKLKRR